MANPWNEWIPGVLNSVQMRQLHSLGLLPGFKDKSFSESSTDLRLSDEGYEMLRGSVKPSTSESYDVLLNNPVFARRIRPFEENLFRLDPKCTYVFRLLERLSEDFRQPTVFYGQATAKSSVGRIDVLVRLIVDQMDKYEYFDAERLKTATGQMYLEITPITFPVLVKPEISLTQLRFFYGEPGDVELSGKEILNTVFGGFGGRDPVLTVNLESEDIAGVQAVAFRAKEKPATDEPIRLWDYSPRPDPGAYWDRVPVEGDGRAKRFQIEKDRFYILRSKERIWVPAGIAIYCQASDETIGEMRIHYAGFVHPWFGQKRKDRKSGAPLIFEVRGHQVDVNLTHGEKMANLIFYRMSENCPETEPKYTDQELTLSGYFSDWT